MPVTISKQDYWDLVYEAQRKKNLNHRDPFDVTWQYPEQLGQGTHREIQLRQGIELAIERYHLHDDIITQSPERSHPLEYQFAIEGIPFTGSIGAGQYALCGSGMAPIEIWERSAAEPIMQISVHIEPELFQTFLGDCELASMGLEHLMRPSDRCYYNYEGITTVAMQTVLHQILHCPFQGITKKVYLESKVWELMAFLVEEEQERHQDKRFSFTLKPDDIERIHHAKEILTQQSDRPPLLLDLARQVGLNDCTLKRGFREVFGTTAFGYLHDYRLEQARQLLLENRLNVSEIANQIGFGSCSYLSKVFRKKYGVSPKQYQTKYKNSV
ncbi:MAG: AraC family transcriptional regulator [Cyanobacteria bacterium P01_G01_bin.39]